MYQVPGTEAVPFLKELREPVWVDYGQKAQNH